MTSVDQSGLAIYKSVICKLLFIDVSTMNNRKITAGVFYRPSNSNFKVKKDLQNYLGNITTDTIITGDFNLIEFDLGQ